MFFLFLVELDVVRESEVDWFNGGLMIFWIF